MELKMRSRPEIFRARCHKTVISVSRRLREFEIFLHPFRRAILGQDRSQNSSEHDSLSSAAGCVPHRQELENQLPCEDANIAEPLAHAVTRDSNHRRRAATL
jgi:hypothetical protein